MSSKELDNTNILQFINLNLNYVCLLKIFIKTYFKIFTLIIEGMYKKNE